MSERLLTLFADEPTGTVAARLVAQRNQLTPQEGVVLDRLVASLTDTRSQRGSVVRVRRAG